MEEPWKKIQKIQDIILYGSDDEEIKFSYDDVTTLTPQRNL